MTALTSLGEGITLTSGSLADVNAFLKTDGALLPGVAILLSGELVPGKVDVKIISGEPIGQKIVDVADKSLQRAVVVSMSTYYDHRHATFLAKSVMVAIAMARGLSEAESSAGLPADTIPFGDIGRMSGAGIALVTELDDLVGYPVINQDHPITSSQAIAG